MGLFNKLFNSSKEKSKEPKTNQIDPKDTDPKGKDLNWFASDIGLETLKAYTTPKSYILQENIEKEKNYNYSEYSLDVFISAVYKDAKVPYVYFKSLIENIAAQPLRYTGPKEMFIKLLSVQAKPFYLGDDGEPQPKDTMLTPSEIVSVEKNPILYFVSNFNCFLLQDDVEGSWNDKWDIFCTVVLFLGTEVAFDKDVISKNHWLFESSTYFNDLGTLRKKKGFIKKGIELASNKKYFEDLLKEVE